jgi:hypothetical protein
MVLALLIVPRANRNPRAWLILIPPVLVILLWQMPMRLFSIPSPDADFLGLVLKSVAIGWTAVWLLGDWLARRHGAVAFLAALVIMFGTGALVGLSYFGVSFDREVIRSSVLYSIGALSLTLGMTISGLCCRHLYSAVRVMLWLVLWLGLSVLASTLVWGIVAVVVEGLGLAFLPMLIFQATIISAVLGGILYLINLPFMILAFRYTFYRERFQSVFRLEDREVWMMTRIERVSCDQPISTEPTTEPVGLDDVTGAWQFYLDDLATTVVIDFKSDGSFTQTMMPTQGDPTEYPGGTWTLEGPRIRLTDYVSVYDGTTQPRMWWMVRTPSGLAVFGGDRSDPSFFFRMSRRLQPAELSGSGASPIG